MKYIPPILWKCAGVCFNHWNNTVQTLSSFQESLNGGCYKKIVPYLNPEEDW